MASIDDNPSPNPRPNPRPRAALLRQFLAFGVVGTLGFLVDAGVLTLVLAVSDLGYYWGRLLSFLAAATVTWALNRRYTFGTAEKSRRLAQWARFLLVNSGGGLVNYATYAALIAASALVRDWPVLGVAAGSIAGLLVNFTFSKWLVFKDGQDAGSGR
jgi:putative flippase GtrA